MITYNLQKLFQQRKGNFGHKGRPGQVGGSAPNGGGIRTATSVLGKANWSEDDQKEFDKGLKIANKQKWSSSDIGHSEYERHEVNLGPVSVSVVRGADMNGLDSYSIIFEKEGRYKYAGEIFFVDDEGIPPALDRAKAYAVLEAPKIDWTVPKRKVQKRKKGPGISYSVYD